MVGKRFMDALEYFKRLEDNLQYFGIYSEVTTEGLKRINSTNTEEDEDKDKDKEKEKSKAQEASVVNKSKSKVFNNNLSELAGGSDFMGSGSAKKNFVKVSQIRHAM